MRLDHIAYRVADRKRAADFFVNAFNYSVQTEFDIDFPDGSSAKCVALEPPEKVHDAPWTHLLLDAELHVPPEIFVSDGSPDSVVGRWVARRGPGVHHLAYQVPSVQKQMDLWRQKGFAEFASPNPLSCPDLVQVFTRPSEITGVVYEFIERGKHGFCRDNVRDLMIASDRL